MSETTHPAAAIFPLLEGTEFDSLVADIRENGLRESIWLERDGRILDGRNRLRACEVAGIEPRFRTYDGDNPQFQQNPNTIAEQTLVLRIPRDPQAAADHEATLIMAIGSFNPDRFQPGMGVELLANMSEVLSFILKPWIAET